MCVYACTCVGSVCVCDVCMCIQMCVIFISHGSYAHVYQTFIHYL